MEFNTCASSNREAFWNCIFGGVWNELYCVKMSREFKDKCIEKTKIEVYDALSNLPSTMMGFCSDAPSVMTETCKLLICETESGTNSVIFLYGCFFMHFLTL